MIRLRASGHTATETPVVVYASPRGGSTWVSKLVFSQPGFCLVSEPLNLRREVTSRELGTRSFGDLYGEAGWKIIEPYYERILLGKVSEFRPLPHEWFYRLNTWRCVFKQNQAGGDHLSRMESRFGFKVIHFVRHPIAVALSRETHPLLSEYTNCPLRDYFSEAQNRFADRVIDKGSHLEKGVLSWCLHHVPAFREVGADRLTLSYEDMVMHSESSMEYLATFLQAEDLDTMKSSFNEPSNVIRKSDVKTRELVNSSLDRSRLVSKWHEKVGIREEEDLMGILRDFSCDFYQAGKDVPA